MNREELKNKYRQTARPMGIYRIRNMQNGKTFLGSAQDLRGIINSNKFQLKNGLHTNKELQHDFDALGETSFSFEILDRLQPHDTMNPDYAKELRTLEEMWLEKLQPYDEKGYNTKRTSAADR